MSEEGTDLDEVLPEEPAADAPALIDPATIAAKEWIARRPAVLAAAGLMIGIAIHARVPFQPLEWAGGGVRLLMPVAWAIVAIACVVVAIIARSRPWRSCAALLVAMIFAGITLAQVDAFYYPADHVAHFATDTPRLAQIELHIDQPPRVLANSFGQYRSLPPKQVTLASVTRIKTWAGWEKCEGQVLVQISQPHPRLAAGQTIRALGLLQRPGPAMNPGQFDWSKYYRDQRILASLQIQQAANIEIVTAADPGLLARLRERTRQLLAMGFPAERSLDHALLRALLVGDSDPELRDVQDQFKQTGTSHHLSISGMHVAVLSGLMLLFCRLLRIAPRWTLLIVASFVLVYGSIAMPSPPVMRAVVMSLAIAAGLLLRRRIDSIQILAVAAILMLVYHPMDLFNARFQLGFGTVLGLILFTRRAIESFRQWRGDYLDPDFREPTLLVRASRKTDHWLTTAFGAGLVAWLVSIPLIAYHFGQLNPWAIPAGIVLGPVVVLALMGGFAKVILTLAWPSGAGAWAWIATQPIAWTRHLVGWLALLPKSNVPLPAPPVWLMLAYYAGLAVFLIPSRRPKWQLALRFLPPGLCLLAIFLPLATGRATQIVPQHSMRLTLLAIGAGQTAVIQTPSDRTFMIDAGSMTQTDMVRKCIGPFLRSAGQREIDSIFLTHGDYDHISAVSDVVSAYDVHDVFTSPRFRLHAVGNGPAEAMLKSLDQIDRPPRYLSRGDSLPIGRDVQLDVLWPPKGSQFDSNNDALVMKVTYGGVSILFPGDIQEPAEKALLADPAQLRADILIAPHHGSSESTTAAFVRAVNPKAILSSNDRTLTGKQKTFEKIIDGRPLYRTNRCGAITVTIDEAGHVDVKAILPP